jgi:hypothetical protein
MDLSNLKPAEGSTKNVKRIGRGQGSGHGGTSTRGHKGAKSRSGYKVRVGLKVVRCLCSVLCQNLVLRISTGLNTKRSI